MMKYKGFYWKLFASMMKKAWPVGLIKRWQTVRSETEKQLIGSCCLMPMILAQAIPWP